MFSCTSVKGSVSQEVKVISGQEHGSSVVQSSRKFYSKKYTPSEVESLLVRPLYQSFRTFNTNIPTKIGAKAFNNSSVRKGNSIAKSRVFWNNGHAQIAKNKDQGPETLGTSLEVIKGTNVEGVTNVASNGDTNENTESNQGVVDHNHGEHNKTQSEVATRGGRVPASEICSTKSSVATRNHTYDKFVNSIIYDQHQPEKPVQCDAYDLWRHQSKVNFGYIPLSDPVMPNNTDISTKVIADPIELHKEVKKHNLPNYLGARIPVRSQLNISHWESTLSEYWDKQLLECIRFGFPLGFNRLCPLRHDIGNHKSALEFPEHVDKYIEEEQKFGAIIGPFEEAPIPNLHYSPFMTRHKPNSETRRVILDLSWPRGESVNAGIEKNGYVGSDFKLTFPTIDDLTQELTKIGRGAHIFKVDVSRAFRHLCVDPRDYDLLGVTWGATFIDTRIPFGSRHGSQNFQRVSDAVRYVMRQRDVNVINYIDDFLGYGTPSGARQSYDALLDVMSRLGLTVSQKKLVAPTTRAVCLGILIDTEQGTVVIPPEKLENIKSMVKEWKGKQHCTMRQLQSLLGTLLYVHKCVKPARYFLNRMLGTLRNVSNPARVNLNDDFQRDLAWFDKFLPQYNGVSMYAHRKTDSILELDACLTGLGGALRQPSIPPPNSEGFCKSRHRPLGNGEYCHGPAFVCSSVVWKQGTSQVRQRRRR